MSLVARVRGVGLVGPGLYLLLRRRRPELGWLVIPLIAVVW